MKLFLTEAPLAYVNAEVDAHIHLEVGAVPVEHEDDLHVRKVDDVVGVVDLEVAEGVALGEQVGHEVVVEHVERLVVFEHELLVEVGLTLLLGEPNGERVVARLLDDVLVLVVGEERLEVLQQVFTLL
eukprot:CAMPEP_0116896758 /NCGR_PEP_ID=MMETSP0467-20121206/5930_1 /TAXON_ID=283647 /ORGANISM="Mesodinium pulex, Strain SPMC105" /LENGTH=127 /DNA_ID=CAMNT_0004568105 /DNA_START=947 /DNA_END=1329 /DNA_ORIENTATION=-